MKMDRHESVRIITEKRRAGPRMAGGIMDVSSGIGPAVSL